MRPPSYKLRNSGIAVVDSTAQAAARNVSTIYKQWKTEALNPKNSTAKLITDLRRHALKVKAHASKENCNQCDPSGRVVHRCCSPAVVELDHEVADRKRAQDLAGHTQNLGIRHHQPCGLFRV